MMIKELNECMRLQGRHLRNAHILRVLIDFADANYQYFPELSYPLYDAVVYLRDIEIVSDLLKKGAAIDPVIARVEKECGVSFAYNENDTPFHVATNLVLPFKLAIKKE